MEARLEDGALLEQLVQTNLGRNETEKKETKGREGAGRWTMWTNRGGGEGIRGVRGRLRR